MVRLEATRNSLTSLDLQLETLTVEDKFLDIPNSRLENKTIRYKNNSYLLKENFVIFFIYWFKNGWPTEFKQQWKGLFLMFGQVGQVFTEMTCRTALTWYTVMKTAFKTKKYNANLSGSLLWWLWIIRMIEEYAYLKKYST